jgi:hypothetical protein
MLSWIATICVDNQSRDGEHGVLRASMTYAIARVIWLCDEVCHWKLPPDVAQEIFDNGHVFLACSRPACKSVAIVAVVNIVSLWIDCGASVFWLQSLSNTQTCVMATSMSLLWIGAARELGVRGDR